MNTKLQFQGEKSPSIAPKIAIISWYLICIAAALLLTFLSAHETDRSGNTGRQIALLACALIFVARAAITFFVFMKRRIPWWEAAWGGSLIGIVLLVFLSNGLRVPLPLGVLVVIGIVLFLIGSYLGTASEYSRHIWKARPENQGHLCKEGLFRYSRHINYFGDLLLFLGFGALVRHMWTGFVPLAMGLNFVFIIIPAHDAYLASRYGSEFEEYARRTKKLVPFLY